MTRNELFTKLAFAFLKEVDFVDIPTEATDEGLLNGRALEQGHLIAAYAADGELIATGATPDDVEAAAVWSGILQFQRELKSAKAERTQIRQAVRLLREL